jgi:protein involved in polysaccharide export with SLBB domain
MKITHTAGGSLMKRMSLCWLMATCIFLMAFGCASNQAVVQDQRKLMAAAPKRPTQYFIQPDDELDIKFFYNPELNEAVTVRPDGKISLQLVDEIQAAGLTPSQLDRLLTRKYSRELKNPEIAVIVKSFAGQRVYVGGEVNRQGLLELTGGMTALQAVINAGGFKETAKPDAAILIRKGPNNEPLPMRIDLEKVIHEEGIGADIQLQPYDIVYVPKTWIANANKWVDQYISKLLLFRGWSFGFTYELRDKVDINF